MTKYRTDSGKKLIEMMQDGTVQKDMVRYHDESYLVGRCHPCKYAKTVVANGQFMFLGCHHEPYHGKWVKEIKDCPKESEG